MATSSENRKHPNSRKVTVFQAPNFLQKQQNNEGVGPYLANTSKSIGPYWERSNTALVGTGLDISEQRLLMPQLLNMHKEDREFNKAVKDFFISLNIKVPYSGLDLETGLLVDNDKPLSETNMPITIADYIKYRFLIKHPWVAMSEAEANGNQLKQFWILDRDAREKEEEARMALHDEARQIYFKIKDEEDKLNMILTLAGGDEREYLSRDGKVKRLKAINDLIDKDVARFLKIYKTDRLETRYWLQAMVKANVLNQIGNSYVIASNRKLIGSSEEEAVLFLENPEHGETLLFLKQATQEAMKKPRKTSKTATA